MGWFVCVHAADAYVFVLWDADRIQLIRMHPVQTSSSIPMRFVSMLNH